MSASSRAQAPGNCTYGQARAILDVNEVRASIFNTGGLAYGGTTTSDDGYFVPKATGKSPLFAAGLWVGGKVNGELRFAGARYRQFNFWPGPLADDGRPVNPTDCSAHDRIYSVTRADIESFIVTGRATADLKDWPFSLGAPVLDGDGVSGNYNLAGGDRPEIIGDQGVWWLMNDVGNDHPAIGSTAPIGLEVSVLAYAFARSNALGSVTFYRHTIKQKGATRLDSTYVSFFADAILGNNADNDVGSDSLLGLGYVYNSDESDEGPSGYGIPPAFGFDILRGPLVNEDTLGATALSYFIDASHPGVADPSEAFRMYFFSQGLWGDGTPMRARGSGYLQPATSPVTTFAFHGDPTSTAEWSAAQASILQLGWPGSSRFLLSTGPFALQPGESQEITLAMLFAQGTDRFDSVDRLMNVSRQVQQAFDADFRSAVVPSPPACLPDQVGSGACLGLVTSDGAVTMLWGFSEASPGYLDRFEETDLFLEGTSATDSTYNLEGYRIFRYQDSRFDERNKELIAVVDKANGNTRIVDMVFDPQLGGLREELVVDGSDRGIGYAFTLDGLPNHQYVYLGLESFAYNEESHPRVLYGEVAHTVGRPGAGLSSLRSTRGEALPIVPASGPVHAMVAAPAVLSGDAYEVRFHHPTDAFGAEIDTVTTYSVLNTTTGATVMDGQAFFEATGEAHPTGGVIRVIDGFQLIVEPGAVAGDSYVIDTADAAPIPATDDSRFASLGDIQIVPNPYLGRSGYDLSADSRVARFTNLPDAEVTVRIFTVGGTLVNTLVKPAGASRHLDWDLTTQTGRPAASGMYLVQIAVEGVGERLLKFGLVQPTDAPR